MSLILLLSQPPSALAADQATYAQRVLVNTSANVTLYVTQDGEPVNPDGGNASIYITRDDGTQLVAPTSADHIDTGVFQYVIPAVLNDQLDWLTATWTLTINGESHVLSTRVEVVGGFLFGLGDARSDPDLQDTTTFTTRAIENARTYAEQELERAVGYAFVPRYTRETRASEATVTLTPYLRTVRAITRAGVSAADTSLLTWDTIGTVTLGGNVTTVTSGSTAIDLAYEHGMDVPPAAVSQAALMLAKDYLTRKPIDDRAIQRITESGDPIFIATPGFQGARFGLPTVDAVINAYRIPAVA